MEHTEPSLELVWGAITGYQRTAVIKAAIDLDLFTYIGAGATTVEALAQRSGAAPRGLRAVLNHLVMDSLLTRAGDHYGLSPTAAMLLDRSSVSYLGSVTNFLTAPMIKGAFDLLTEAVRRGGTAVPQEGSLAPEHPMWVEFARSMAPLAGMLAMLLGNLLDIESLPGGKVLDVAAGHGMFGISLARRNPKLQITALDWDNVLAVAEENARQAGVHDRFTKLIGSAFDVALGENYDLILVPNFLHHFDPPTCEKFLKKARAALAPSGRVVIVEFIPDDDRSGPPEPVRFATVMLASTPAGDAYTFAEYKDMLQHAGFTSPTLHELQPSPGRVVIAAR